MNNDLNGLLLPLMPIFKYEREEGRGENHFSIKNCKKKKKNPPMTLPTSSQHKNQKKRKAKIKRIFILSLG